MHHKYLPVWLTVCLLLTATICGAQANNNNAAMNITIGHKTFTANLANTAAADKLKTLLPLVLEMTELNNNEKYADLPAALPAEAANPGTIHAGDIMLYGTTTVVVFYKTFTTGYSYTKLGHINNAAGLVSVLGKGSVTISFDVK